MKAVTTEEATVLVPDPLNKNFTHTTERIPKNTVVEGEIKIIEGLKRKKPFKYNLFFTNDNRIIFTKTIEPMERTEVTLGADGKKQATTINLPTTSNLGMYPIGGALLGICVGLYVAKKRNATSHHAKVIYSLVGGLIGFTGGKYLQSRRSVRVQGQK